MCLLEISCVIFYFTKRIDAEYRETRGRRARSDAKAEAWKREEMKKKR